MILNQDDIRRLIKRRTDACVNKTYLKILQREQQREQQRLSR